MDKILEEYKDAERRDQENQVRRFLSAKRGIDYPINDYADGASRKADKKKERTTPMPTLITTA